MKDLDIIQIGNKDFSSLILVLPISFKEIENIKNLNEIIQSYFIEDVTTIFITNQEELDKDEFGSLLKFVKN